MAPAQPLPLPSSCKAVCCCYGARLGPCLVPWAAAGMKAAGVEQGEVGEEERQCEGAWRERLQGDGGVGGEGSYRER